MNNIDPLVKKRIVVGTMIFIILSLLLISILSSKNKQQPTSEDTHEGGSESTVLVTDLEGPFTITYLGNLNGTYLMSVTNSSPGGRQKAVQWLQDQGYDISKTTIQFVDFKNPLDKGQSLE